MTTTHSAYSLPSRMSGWRLFFSVVVLLAAFFVSCGGRTGIPLRESTEAPSAMLVATSSGELLRYVKAKIKESAAQGGVTSEGKGNRALVAVSQELGTDEDDWVKTDGVMLYGLSKSYGKGSTAAPAQLQAQRRLSNGQLAEAGRLTLDAAFVPGGMYLTSAASSSLVVWGQHLVDEGAAVGTSLVQATGGPRIGLDWGALTQPGTLNISKRIRIDGTMVGSRRIGKHLYVISRSTPDLSRYAPTAGGSAVEGEAQLAKLKVADILPTIQIDEGSPTPLLSDASCYVQAENASAQVVITTITAFDVSSPSMVHSSRCFVGGSQALYLSPAHVYLTSSHNYSDADDVATRVYPEGAKTDVHKFALQGMDIDYRGSGEVTGHLGWDGEKMSYRMNEYLGDLRVLSFTGQTGWRPMAVAGTANPSVVPAMPASPALLTVLRESSGKTLKSVGGLPNASYPTALGRLGEQLYGVQFVGPRAYLETFRTTDPLYVLDMSNGKDPKPQGELKIAGYADHLLALGDKLLLGVGKVANGMGQGGGVNVALIDVGNPGAPMLLSSLVIGKRGSLTALDLNRHGITVQQQGGVYRIALPVRVYATPSAQAPLAYLPTDQGLRRFEVDSATQTLVSKTVVPGVSFAKNAPNDVAFEQYNLQQERGVLMENAVYYFAGGQFLASAW